MQILAVRLHCMGKVRKSSTIRCRVAVITRTRERPLLLERAMQSVAGQSVRDFVWVIVNDGGAKDPIEVTATKARRKGVEVIIRHLPRQNGMEYASNVGINTCKSDYIAIHDDDDAWNPDFLKTMLPVLDARRDWLGAACRTEQVTERIEGGKIIELERAVFMPWVRAFYLIDMLQQNLFPPIAFLFRRSIYDKLGGFDAKLPVLGDWDFHLRVLQAGEIGLVDQMLATYHLRHQEGPDGNTITANIALHAEIDALIRNRWLRQDLAKGRFGLGSLAGLARQHNAMWKLLRR
jgi:glycosyltransferase involved in cell wall biosynthesis